VITFSILGGGNLGVNLTYALSSKGYRFKYVYKKSKFKIYSSNIEKSLKKIVLNSDVFFLSVQESRIEDLVKEIENVGNLSEKIFFHTSNSLTSDELIPLKEKGALVASFSPLQTFSSFYNDEDIFKSVCFLFEGDGEALKTAKKISSDLGAHCMEVEKSLKIYFHIGAVASSNFLNSLMRFADIQIKKGGGNDYKILLPLVRQTLNNIEKNGLEMSLTGPADRKENEIILKHMELLSGEDKKLYEILTNLLSSNGGYFS